MKFDLLKKSGLTTWRPSKNVANQYFHVMIYLWRKKWIIYIQCYIQLNILRKSVQKRVKKHDRETCIAVKNRRGNVQKTFDKLFRKIVLITCTILGGKM